MPVGSNIGAWQYNGATPGALNIGAWQGYPDVIPPVPPTPPTPPPDVIRAYRNVLRQYKIYFRYFFLPFLLQRRKLLCLRDL